MISLQAVEVEIMCAEMYRYFQEAEQALHSDEIRTNNDASELAASLGEIKPFLKEVLLHEEEKGGNRMCIQLIELLAKRCATLEEQAQGLRSCFSRQGESRAA